MTRNFVLLHSQDNILVCCQDTKSGEELDIDSEKLRLSEDICMGHKIARRSLSAGNKIIKYGQSIGSALRDIDAGEHVHMHNMKSDYIPPHTRERLQRADRND